jgi:hypothetical protein
MLTDQQIERWKDFSLRMARTCYQWSRRPSTQWIVETVEGWWDRLDFDTARCYVDWDNSDEYPEGHLYRGQEYLTGRWNTASLPCDDVAEFLDRYRGYSPRCRACDWDDDYDGECRCDEIEELWYERWQDQWGDPIHCCIRAGLGAAVEGGSGAGVLGCSAGDLRAMYPEGVPEWVMPAHTRLHYWPSGELNGTFAELADNAGMVL